MGSILRSSPIALLILTAAALAIAALAPEKSAHASTNPTRLFQRGKPHRNYDEIVFNLRSGDQVAFSNGQVFTVTHNYVPDSGRPDKGTTAVLAISDHRVLRIPKRCSEPTECERNQHYLREFVEGWGPLRHFGVPTPQLFLSDSYLPEYVAVERLVVDENLRDWLNRWNEYPDSRNALEVAALRRFASHLAPFSMIGDFYDAQVAKTPKGFVLMDWTSAHINYREGIDLTLNPLANLLRREDSDTLIRSLIETLRASREVHACRSLLDSERRRH